MLDDKLSKPSVSPLIEKSMSSLPPAPVCPACGGPIEVIAFGGPCNSCVMARARTVAARGRCVCAGRAVPGEEIGPGLTRPGRRRWIPCKRCLGVIRQTG